jgi:signal transduction histidine kinase
MQKNFKMIEQNFNYLETLVKDTLNIARLDSGKVLFNNELINIKIIIDNIIENNESVFTKNKVTIINKAESTLVECDKLRIKEVMENIIMNAIKFMERDPKTLTFSSIKSDKDLTVSIQDSGIGIDKDKLKIIFDEFTKLDTSRHEHSSGLGLAICKRIIEKHKGIIWAESEGLGKGTTIKFSLPVKEQARDKDDTSISS